jgi:rhodanese-related sulfurtransferase
MSTTDYSDIVGIFRDRSQADQAVDELKQAGFSRDEIQLTEYELHGAVETFSSSPSLQPSSKRIIVHVKSPGREQEAVGIMAQHGANNADIPAGMKLDHGTLTSSNAETVDLVPGQSNEASSSDDLFGEVTLPGQPGEINSKDKTDTPHV